MNRRIILFTLAFFLVGICISGAEQTKGGFGKIPVSDSAQKSAKAAIAKGIEYYDAKELNKALEQFTYAITANPQDAEAYTRRSRVYFRKGNPVQGLADLNQAIKINPNYSLAYQSRAFYYFGVRDFDKAWADVHKLESLGHQWGPGFLEVLKKESGRSK